MAAPFVLLVPGAFDDLDVGDGVALPEAVRHHLTRVLRARDGDLVEAADGAGTQATTRLRGDRLVLTVPAIERPAPQPRLEVLQALGKGRKHDEVVRALTELGVDRIVAVTTERTVVDWDADKAGRARQRWLKVAAAACEQARRPHLPDVDGPIPLTDALAGVDAAPCLVAHVGAVRDPLEVAVDLRGWDRVRLAVGPEGGFSDAELERATAVGAVTVSLGSTVLRTEHAATVLASVVAAATGRMRSAP